MPISLPVLVVAGAVALDVIAAAGEAHRLGDVIVVGVLSDPPSDRA